MDKKKLRNDIVLVISLLVIAVIALIIVLTTRKKDNLVAVVKYNNEVVEVIDLNDKTNRDYYINGLHGIVHINTHDGAIAVVESNCPHQDCVHMGYVSETNRPIICAYNAVYIVILGEGSSDIVIG